MCPSAGPHNPLRMRQPLPIIHEPTNPCNDPSYIVARPVMTNKKGNTMNTLTRSLSPLLLLGVSVGTVTGAAAAPHLAAHTTARVQVASNSHFGRILTNQNGMTVYYFKSDPPNLSTCFGSCTQVWQPLLVARNAGFGNWHLPGKLTTLTRSGGLQLSYNSWPLYTFTGDKKPGQTRGQGIAGGWFVATPTLRLRATPRVSPPPVQMCIPGMNGGDMDGDNNGAPSDGDGCRGCDPVM
jgi:predicted lipoprotein with Yx(FWY)xxD motif